MKYLKDWCTSSGINTSLATMSDNFISSGKGLYSTSCINKFKAKKKSQILFFNFLLIIYSLCSASSSLLNIKFSCLVCLCENWFCPHKIAKALPHCFERMKTWLGDHLLCFPTTSWCYCGKCHSLIVILFFWNILSFIKHINLIILKRCQSPLSSSSSALVNSLSAFSCEFFSTWVGYFVQYIRW